jgi:hypothetical protein
MPSGDRLMLELDPAEGHALRLEWDVEALRELSGSEIHTGADHARPTWRWEREPDWGHAGALRLISASFDDGALLAVAALRPQQAVGHDVETVGAALMTPQGEATRLHEALLSTEYGPDGRARRLGLELYEEPADPPLRVVADRVAEARPGAGGEQTAMRLRMEGTPGAGLYELVLGG